MTSRLTLSYNNQDGVLLEKEHTNRPTEQKKGHRNRPIQGPSTDL